MPPAPAAWVQLLRDDGWVLLASGEALPDVVINFGPSSLASEWHDLGASVIQMIMDGEPWAGEGVDFLLLRPSPQEFLATCDRALRRARARRLSTEYLVEVLDCAQDAVFVVDWDRCVVFQNRQALAVVASIEGGDGDILGLPLEDHVPHALRAQLSTALDSVLVGFDPRSFETLASGAWSETIVSFIPGGAAVNVRDISQRKAAEDEQRNDRIEVLLDRAVAEGKIARALADAIRPFLVDEAEDANASERVIGTEPPAAAVTGAT